MAEQKYKCPRCGDRGWHTAGGNDPMACSCDAGQAWSQEDVPVEIIPNEGESYEGRQYGWMIMLNGTPYARAWTGGTGACWNVLFNPEDEDDAVAVHFCELDEAISALTALRDSSMNAAHRKRWGRQ